MKSLIVCSPHVTEVEIINDVDQFVVLACDGLWDFVDDVVVCETARNAFSNGLCAHQVAQVLVSKALDSGSTDNVSVLVVRLDADDE